jgi:hypothetical protein
LLRKSWPRSLLGIDLLQFLSNLKQEGAPFFAAETRREKGTFAFG